MLLVCCLEVHSPERYFCLSKNKKAFAFSLMKCTWETHGSWGGSTKMSHGLQLRLEMGEVEVSVLKIRIG